jgi:hypothetical protein
VNEEMYVHQLDIVSAYVQEELQDEVYMEQPEMFAEPGNKDKMCKLQNLCTSSNNQDKDGTENWTHTSLARALNDLKRIRACTFLIKALIV